MKISDDIYPVDFVMMEITHHVYNFSREEKYNAQKCHEISDRW